MSSSSIERRPAIAEKRLSLANQGKVHYELKTPDRDGTTHVIFEPVGLHREWMTPARRGKGSPKLSADQDEKTLAQGPVAMTGFCSCKTGIHAIHGNNMGSGAETGIQH